MKARPAPLSVGLRDVAKAAGVSTATVSRAMSSPELVSPELRDEGRQLMGEILDDSDVARECEVEVVLRASSGPVKRG